MTQVTLEQSYEHCRQLNKQYGTTYYWSATVLPSVKRHHVHALYGFCRHADDIVDDLGDVSADVRAKALADFGERFFEDLDAGDSDDPVLKAMVHTVQAFRIDPDCVRRFLRSMTMDLTVETLRDLRRSARLHGRLGRRDRRDDAAHPRADRPGRHRCRSGARQRVPAHQFPPRHRRGPRPLPRVRAPGGHPPLRRRVGVRDADRHARVPRPHAFEIDRTRGSVPRGRRGPRPPARPVRPLRRALPACSTAASSTGSRRSTSTCSPARARVPTWQKVGIAGRALVLGR